MEWGNNLKKNTGEEQQNGMQGSVSGNRKAARI